VQSIYEGGRKVTAVDRATIALEEASVAVDEAEQKLSLALVTAVANRDNAEEALVSAQASIRSAKENLETVREQFAIGSSDRIELSDAIASDSRARGDCISAFYDGQRAEAALYEILGVPPMFTEELVKGDLK
jgi:outer membrane protein